MNRKSRGSIYADAALVLFGAVRLDSPLETQLIQRAKF